MDEKKNFSDEMLKKYISSEVSKINELKKDPSQWKTNKNFNSQITIKLEEGVK